MFCGGIKDLLEGVYIVNRDTSRIDTSLRTTRLLRMGDTAMAEPAFLSRMYFIPNRDDRSLVNNVVKPNGRPLVHGRRLPAKRRLCLALNPVVDTVLIADPGLVDRDTLMG